MRLYLQLVLMGIFKALEYLMKNLLIIWFFKESTVIDNAFDVFIRTSDYEQKRQNLDNRLLRLKVDIDEKQPIIQLKNDIAAFCWKIRA